MRVRVEIGQYEFVEFDCDTVEEAGEKYGEIKREFKSGGGITDKEMDAVIDCMLKGETVRGGIEIYNRMTPWQQGQVQTLKRAIKRVNSKSKDN